MSKKIESLEELISDEEVDVDAIIDIIINGNYDPKEKAKNGYSMISLACLYSLSEVAIALIQKNPELVGEVLHTIELDEDDEPMEDSEESTITALQAAIITGLDEVAIELIETGHANIGFQNLQGKTALMYALSHENLQIAKKLIETGESNPGAKSLSGDTALMIACQAENNEEIISALIKTGQAEPGAENKHGLTALLICCALENYTNIKLLIETGQSNPDAIDLNDDTALHSLCRMISKKSNPKLFDIISSLIKTGKSNPGVINIKGDTALLALCSKAEAINLDKIILELIATGQSIPGFIDKEGFTPLIMCCKRNRYYSAKALIETGESNAFIRCNDEKTALEILKPKGPPELIALLEFEIDKHQSLTTIDTSQIGFDMVGSQETNIKEFLKKSKTNACIKFGSDKYFLFSTKDFRRVQMISKDYFESPAHTELVYICDSRSDEIRESVYVDFKTIIPIPCLISYLNLSNIEERLESHPSENTRCFLMTYTGHTVRGIAAMDGAFTVEDGEKCADNVKRVYRLTMIKPSVEQSTASTSASASSKSTSASESVAVEHATRKYVRINYKNVQYKFDITPGTTTIADLKQMFLAKLLETEVISSLEQIVRLIYPGKQFDDSSIISEIITTRGETLYGAQFTAMVRVPGGTRKRKNRKTKRIQNKKTQRNL
jgi:ankyrin repeat protein